MAHSSGQTRPTALVVDDSWYMQLTMADVLEAEGYRVHTAADGSSALDLYDEVRPDVVLMDLVLPDLDGISAMQGIRRLDSDARVVVVTGLLDDGARLAAMRSGASGFLPKPFSVDLLLRAVETVKKAPAIMAPQLQFAG
jgi:two-component system chemotaxis response regulator CheY